MSIALALGGGAALGWAHIGILKTLERHGIAVDAVAGTSIGALVAVALAGGATDALEALARSATPRAVLRFLDPQWRRGGMLGARTIARTLAQHLGDRPLEALAMPCAVIAADLATGRPVLLRHGNAVEAVLASIAIPGVFAPVRRDGALLVDGGAVMPVPVAAARALSGRPVIAVNLQGDYARRAARLGVGTRMPSTLVVTRAGLALVLARLAELSLALDPADLVIEPMLGEFSVSAFTRGDALIAAGAAAAQAAMPAILALAAQPSAMPKP